MHSTNKLSIKIIFLTIWHNGGIEDKTWVRGIRESGFTFHGLSVSLYIRHSLWPSKCKVPMWNKFIKLSFLIKICVIFLPVMQSTTYFFWELWCCRSYMNDNFIELFLDLLFTIEKIHLINLVKSEESIDIMVCLLLPSHRYLHVFHTLNLVRKVMFRI